MSHPEFSHPDPEFALIGLAQLFTGKSFSNNRRGLEEALTALKNQHKQVMPQLEQAKLREIVLKDEPLIYITEQMSAIALQDSDYEAALQSANYLYAFGEVDYQDSLGGKAFDLSLKVHRKFADKIYKDFSVEDPYLRVAGKHIFEDIKMLRKGEKYAEELDLIRGLIHTVALNGTLGKDTRRQFDPFALVKVQ